MMQIRYFTPSSTSRHRYAGYMMAFRKVQQVAKSAPITSFESPLLGHARKELPGGKHVHMQAGIIQCSSCSIGRVSCLTPLLPSGARLCTMGLVISGPLEIDCYTIIYHMPHKATPIIVHTKDRSYKCQNCEQYLCSSIL